MRNVFFPDEEISENDLYFVCSMIERTARKMKQPNKYVANRMGKVYARLILSTITHDENYADGILRVYNNLICEVIDNYNGSAYYEPSYFITRA